MFLDGAMVEGSCSHSLPMYSNRIIDKQFNSDRCEPGGICTSRAVLRGFFRQEKLGPVMVGLAIDLMLALACIWWLWRLSRSFHLWTANSAEGKRSRIQMGPGSVLLASAVIAGIQNQAIPRALEAVAVWTLFRLTMSMRETRHH